mmetsp:Transcript_25149/g.40860  ORF Transcript_25149/g.40860 Transcript_25149/m.40860 type:complete len:406 (-) Transcript_25149:142-1359(-)
MGHCFSIEIEPWEEVDQNEQQMEVHRSLTDDASKPNAPNASKCLSQSSDDEETSQSDGQVTDADKVLRSHESIDLGKAQSPLDIVTVTVNRSAPVAYQAMDAAEQTANPLKFNYPDLLRGCSIMNTGFTVQVNIPDHTKCNVAINQEQPYHLRQFYFKTPSEHTFDGQRFDMEMQLVHENEDKEVAIVSFLFSTKQRYEKPTLMLRKARKSMVKQAKSIVVQYMREKANRNQSDDDEEDDDDPLHQAIDDDMAQDVDDDSDDSEAEFVTAGNARKQSMVPSNDFLKQFWSELPIQQTAKEAVLSRAISFDYLFECASNDFKPALKNNEIGMDMKFFEYDGSLTTPPFTEGVKWMVSKKINYISDKQMNELRSCWGNGLNSRNTQEYNGRVVKLRNECSLRGYFFN